MPAVKRLFISCIVAASVNVGPVLAQKCQPDAVWSNKHADASSETVTTEAKGSRATTIEVCRDKQDTGAGLKTIVLQFAGSHDSLALAPGQCHLKFAKWATIRTVGTQIADGKPAEAKGIYRICKD